MPAVTGSGEPVLFTDRSALGELMAVVAEAELLPDTGSAVMLDAADAELVKFPVAPESTVTTIVAVAVAPPVRSCKLHKTVPEDSPHEPWLALADTNVVPDGRLSSTSTLSAMSGPLFVTVTT